MRAHRDMPKTRHLEKFLRTLSLGTSCVLQCANGLLRCAAARCSEMQKTRHLEQGPAKGNLALNIIYVLCTCTYTCINVYMCVYIFVAVVSSIVYVFCTILTSCPEARVAILDVIDFINTYRMRPRSTDRVGIWRACI